MPRDSRVLNSTAAVIKALGGPDVVAALTGATTKLVSGWKTSNIFPAHYFFVMTVALHSKRLTANPELWRQVMPADRRRAVAAVIAVQQQLVAAA